MKRLITRLFILCVSLLTLAVGAMVWFAQSPLSLKQPTLSVTLEPGSGMRQIARQIVDSGVNVPPQLLVWLARITRQDNLIKAGSYELEQGITPLRLLDRLSRGDSTQAELALIEGWNIRQVRAALDRHPDLRHDTRGLSDAALIAQLGLDARHPEGLFFPDTYLFARQSSDLAVLRRAARHMQDVLGREWAGRAEGLPYRSAYEALIMASIVEKETGQAADRPKVASVFVNRLRQGMCPSPGDVTYAMRPRKRHLLHRGQGV